MPGVVLLVAVWAFGLGLLPIFMLVDAGGGFMSATADSTFRSISALCLVVVESLAMVTSHWFRNVGSGSVFSEVSKVDPVWNWARESAENGSCRVSFSVLESLRTGDVGEFCQVVFGNLKRKS